MTQGMKVAVSIPDELFRQADRIASTRGVSRSAIFADALHSYVQAHTPERVTEELNAALDSLDQDRAFVTQASTLTLSNSEW